MVHSATASCKVLRPVRRALCCGAWIVTSAPHVVRTMAQTFDGVSKECKACINGRKRCGVCMIHQFRNVFSGS